MRTLVTLLSLFGLVAPTSASAQNSRMLTLLSAGNYAEAATQYQQLYDAKGDIDDLFNAAFYSHRAGRADDAKKLAESYLTKSNCRANANATPRRVRHCALAAELAGDLDQALELFKKYRDVARLWVHRSRADGGIERVKLRLALAQSKAANAELTAKCKPAPTP